MATIEEAQATFNALQAKLANGEYTSEQNRQQLLSQIKEAKLALATAHTEAVAHQNQDDPL
jgi:Asp-tRNA(Asn)/Glu-tRNA(Gln) amidotransferase A subunit family amidase